MDRASIHHELETNGYVVLPGVLTPEQCDRAHSQIWDFLEGLGTGLKRDEPLSWTTANRPAHSGGLLQHYNVAWQRGPIEVRMAVASVFAVLYGCLISDLITSADGISVTRRPLGDRWCRFTHLTDFHARKWEYDSSGRPTVQVHVDQTSVFALEPGQPTYKCVQGGVAITAQAEDEHTLVLVPGSHRIHAELMALGPTKKTPGWEIMNAAQRDLLRKHGLDLVRVALPRGAMVLWRSDLVHASSGYCASSRPDAQRIQVFVCMQPVPPGGIPPKNKSRRMKAYEEGIVTKHDPLNLRLFGKKPRTYGKPQAAFVIPPSAPMSAAERRLHGLPFVAEGVSAAASVASVEDEKTSAKRARVEEEDEEED